MAWLAHGRNDAGFILEAGAGSSRTVPAVAAYRGRLWVLWSDSANHLWYTVSDNDGHFSDRQPFETGTGLPVMTNLSGYLHVIVVLASGQMVHYFYDEDESRAWKGLGALDPGSGAVTHSSPALVAFHNKLFLAFIRDGRLFYMIWTAANNGQWSEPSLIDEAGTSFNGIPALFVIDGVLHLLCAANESREITGYQYDYIAAKWTQRDDISEGKAARGVSAASYGENAYLGFIEDGPGDVSHGVYIAAYANGRWQPQEAVDGQSAADPPQIAILNGRIHCIFNDNTAGRDLRWYSRPVLSYSLSSWMAKVPDDTPLSAMTIPGTHDSCARSNIPFVRTQYLSIAQQLRLGIRFFDLRLRTHDNGKLYCYHGGIPIDFPTGLSFDSVMGEIWAFLQPRAGVAPTETVLVSINNDDTSQPQKDDPAPFYAAVQAAILAAPPYPETGRSRWMAEPVTSTLGEARGRAVLLRRYAGDPAVAPVSRLGLDLSGWKDDNPDFDIVTPTRVTVHLQDKWKYADRVALQDLVLSKFGFVRAMMEKAAAAAGFAPGDGADADQSEQQQQQQWFINFCSAVGDPVEHGEVAESKWIAVGAHSDIIGKWVPGMNRRTNDYLQQAGGGRKRLGIVNLDYPELPEDNDVVARLIELNF